LGIFYYICIMKTEFKDKVKSVVNKYGFEYALTMFDDKEIVRLAYGDNPSEFLNQFNDLRPVEKGDVIYYVNKDGLTLFYYVNEKNAYVYINFERIWMFYSKVIGLIPYEIMVIMNKWLEDTYNLKDITPKPKVMYMFIT
jgi:hypothetical protein